MAFDPLTAVSGLVDTVVKRIWPDATAEEANKLEMLKTAIALDLAQQEVNKAEAAHPSVFVAGWRPFVGWVAGLGMAYSFIGAPFLGWISAVNEWPVPPQLNLEQLITVLITMLGMGGLRTYEGMKGIKRTGWKPAVAPEPMN